MNEAEKDTRRAIAACRAILDGRDPQLDGLGILVTAEHAIATLLLTLMGDPRKAAAMLNEGLAPGVEARIALDHARGAGGAKRVL